MGWSTIQAFTVFKMILCDQLTDYFEINQLFHPCQHGFGKNHSCETALHEIISDLNNAKDKGSTVE